MLGGSIKTPPEILYLYGARALRGFGDGFADPDPAGLPVGARLQRRRRSASSHSASLLGLGAADLAASASSAHRVRAAQPAARQRRADAWHRPGLLRGSRLRRWCCSSPSSARINPSSGDVERLRAAGACDAGPAGRRPRTHRPLRALQPGRRPDRRRSGALAVGAARPLAPRCGVVAADGDQGDVRPLRLLGLAAALIYRAPAARPQPAAGPPHGALGPSRGIVYKLAALFSLDSFAGGFLVQSLLALWLFQRFGLSLATRRAFFFWSGLLTRVLISGRGAGSSRRIGLINTMVFTHIPSSLCLIAGGVRAEPDRGAGAAAGARRRCRRWTCRRDHPM